MPRQNRVDPYGNLIATSARGTLMGNRGCLHDADGRLTRRQWTTQAWIACRLSFQGRRRTIMAPGRYTELFFLDEATALAVGHRPCGECRRDAYRNFKAAWCAGNHRYNLDVEAPVQAIDRIIHAERVGRRRYGPIRAAIGDLPDGVFIHDDETGTPWLVAGSHLIRWSPFGYDMSRPRPAAGTVSLITPVSIVAAFAAGYRAGVHPTAAAFAAEPLH